MMRTWLRMLVLTGLLGASMAPQAAELVSVRNAWARATVPGQEVGAAYMDLQSSADAQLVKVESPVADAVEIHQMSMKDGVMEMRMMESLTLPAGKVVKLEPGGFHLMLIDLKQPLQAGKEVAVTLHAKDAKGQVHVSTISVPVRAR